MIETTKHGKKELVADEDGMVLVSCPLCGQDFDALLESIKNRDIVICSHCKNELSEVRPPQKDLKLAEKMAADWGRKHISDELNKTIKKLNI